jgi:hypothetical protein
VLVTGCASSHAARVLGFPMVAERPRICIDGFLARSLVMTISRVAPRSSESRRWTSSTTRSVSSESHGVLFLVRESTFSEVAMMISFLPRYSSRRS